MNQRLSAHDLGWSKEGLCVEDVMFALGHGRDPDTDHFDGPVEKVLYLGDPEVATACQELLHEWRLSRGRVDEAARARSIWAFRLIRLERLDLLKKWPADFMVTQSSDPSRGPLGLFLKKCSEVDPQDGRGLCKVLYQRHAQGIRNHRGLHGVAELWEVLGWLGQSSTGQQVVFKKTQTKKAVEREIKRCIGPIDPAALPPDLVILAQSLAQTWKAHLQSGAPAQGPSQLAQTLGWMESWLNLGSNILQGVEIATALYEAVPDLAHGFGCLRQGQLKVDAVQMHLDNVALLYHAKANQEGADAFAWAALPLPHQTSSAEKRAELSDKWCDLVQRRPQWVNERPLPRDLEQNLLPHDEKLCALWRQARHHGALVEPANRRRARP